MDHVLLRVNVTIIPEATTTIEPFMVRDVLFDTGFAGGLLIPPEVARRAGATLITPDWYPRTLTGQEVPGLATVLDVSLPALNARAETFIFCPTVDVGNECLLGAQFCVLSDIVVARSDLELPFAHRRRRNRGQPAITEADLKDLRWLRIPTHRPRTRWWTDEQEQELWERNEAARRQRGE